MKANSASRLTLLLIWGFSLALLAVVAVTVVIVRQQHRDEGLATARSYARLSAEHMASSLRAADLTLASVVEQISTSQGTIPNLAVEANRPVRERLSAVMKAGVARLSLAESMILADPDGRLIVSSQEATPGANIDVPSFVRAFKNNAGGRLVLSDAYRNEQSGHLMLLVGKPLLATDGGLAGVAALAVDLDEQFGSFYAALGLPPGSTVSLYSDKHQLLTRFPQLEERIGKAAPTPAVSDLLSGHRTEASLFSRSTVDRQDRVFVIRDVAQYPLSVLVSLTETYYMGFANTFTHWAIGGGLGIVLLAGMLSILVVRKRQSDSDLLDERQRQIAFFKEITATVPGVIFTFYRTADGAMYFPYASIRVNEFFGVTPAVLAQSAQPVLDAVHPEDRPEFLASIKASADVLSPWSGKWRYRHIDGTWHWMQGQALPRREGVGDVLWHGYVADISERQRADEIEVESDALVKAAQDSLMAHVAVLDRDGTIVSVNEGWRRFALDNQRDNGVAVANVGIGTNYLGICQDSRGPFSDEASLVSDGIRAVLDGREPTFQAIYPCHSPTEQRWFQMSAAPLRTVKGGAVVSHANITRLIQAEEALRETEQYFRTLANSGSALIWAAGLDMEATYFNDAWLLFTGRSLEQELGRGWLQGIHLEDAERHLIIFQAAFNKREPFSNDYRLHHAGGGYRWIQDNGVPRFDTQGSFVGYLGNCLDITDRKKNEMELGKLSLAVEQSPDSIVVTDQKGTIEYVNQAFVNNTGYSSEQAVGQNPSMLQSGKTPKATFQAMWAALSSGQVWRGELINRRRDGSEYIESAMIAPVRETDGEISHYLAVKRDITEKRRAEAEINRLSYYDPLTGLANRPLLMDRLGHLLLESRQESRQGALLIIDIDRFKNFNDARGHDLGDALLVALAQRVSGLLRDGDTLARLSGDEFAILIKDLSPQREGAGGRILSVAEKVHLVLRSPFLLDQEEMMITASIGITLVPEIDSDTTQEVFRRADTALHRAKEAGGNQSAFFETKMGELAQQRFRIERDLRRGIPAGELRLYLQPQVNAAGRAIGAEALVRWQHPERGLVPPIQFVPIAEESDLIVELDVWVMTEVCELLARQEMQDCPVRISVNVSPRHFRQAGFIPWLRDLLLTSGTDPNRLTLEFTEGLVIDNINDVIAKMSELASLGIHFSIDDFGTGYSSLAYLKRLPINELKIDKSFVQDAPDDPNDAALVEAILAVAGHLHLQVVAEGVETVAQAEFLNSRATVIHQGYLFGRPEPVELWLSRRNQKRLACPE